MEEIVSNQVNKVIYPRDVVQQPSVCLLGVFINVVAIEVSVGPRAQMFPTKAFLAVPLLNTQTDSTRP